MLLLIHLLLSLVLVFQCDATVSFASVFIGESVVLQSGRGGARIWGSASVGAAVSLTIDGTPAGSANTDASGRWELLLPEHAVSWRSELVASDASGGSATTVVRFGITILCSGQSNMELSLSSLSNGTAEADAAASLTGKISILTLEVPFPKPTLPPWNGTNCPGWPPAPSPDCTPQPQWNAVSPGANGTVLHFSGLCFLTGKAIFNSLSGTTPIGLIAGSVGGSAIEIWLPKGVLGTTCPSDIQTPCDTASNLTDSQFYDALILPFAPYTLGAVLWDQAERDVHCLNGLNKTSQYPCMERALVSTWRQAFKSDFAFAAIQLPGYIGDCDSVSKLQPDASYYNCVPGVFNMRLAQAEGVVGIANASVIPTYDLSCPFGVVTPECPFGSVHNVNKTIVATRAARTLLTGLEPTLFPLLAGPVAVSVTAGPTGRGFWEISISFDEAQLALKGTQYCVACCSGEVGDFDASVDGISWVNATTQSL